ncbi:MAG: stalk domain-containing protein, partial [Bacillota bacterium]|nr:stalk domain-containing protein [Bacillota bacterium]
MYNKGTAFNKTIIFLASLLFAIVIAGIFTFVSNAEMFPWGEEPDVSLKVNGKTLEMDVPPKIIESRTMIPARALFEYIGGNVSWNASNYSVTVKYNGQTIILYIDSNTAKVDGVSKSMDVPPQIVDDRTLIPLRFVSEALGFDVSWENSTRTAIVNTPDTNTEDPEIPVENPGTIEKISVNFGQESNMFTSVKLVSDKPFESDDYKTMTLSNPDRYVIDFINFKADSNCLKTLGSVDNMRCAVSSVRSSMYDSLTFRLVFEMNNLQSPSVSFSSDKKEMTVYFKK